MRTWVAGVVLWVAGGCTGDSDPASGAERPGGAEDTEVSEHADSDPEGRPTPDTDTEAEAFGPPTVRGRPEFASDEVRQYHAVAELEDGRIFVTGGLIMRAPSTGGGAYPTGREATELYDLEEGKIVAVDPLHQGRMVATRDHAS